MERYGKPTCRVIALFCLSLLFSLHSGAQTQIPFVNSGEVLQEGIAQYDKGEYKAALKLYQQVPEGDTNYRLALSEQVLAYLADSDYARVIEMATEALQEPGDGYRRQFTLLLGHAYDYTGHPDSAFACYDRILRIDPYDYQPWYEKGAVYARAKNYDAAMACFRHSLVLNPYHFRSHYMTGLILALQGRLSEAYLALSTSLFISNDVTLAKEVIRQLAAIAEENDDMAKTYRNRNKELVPPAWEEIDEIISAKLPLSKDYRFKSDLNGEEIINDLHAIMEKVRYDPKDTSVTMQYYVPLYNKIMDDDQFEPMVLFMFSGYDIKKVEALAKHNKSDMKEVRTTVLAYLDHIAATGIIDYRARKDAKEQYAFIPDGSYFI